MGRFVLILLIALVLVGAGGAGVYFFKPELFDSIIPRSASNTSVPEALAKAKEAEGRQDFKEAANWYHLAADKGDALAQVHLGVLHAQGKGVEKDAAEAVKWYKKAAEQNNTDAQYNLGAMYDEGEGVEQDGAEAVKWYRLAAENGLKEARQTADVEHVGDSAIEEVEYLLDCPESLTAEEKQVCTGADLAKLETDLAVDYFISRNQARDREALRTAQEAWFKAASGSCADVACMISAFTEKKQEFVAATERPSVGRHFRMPDYPPASLRAQEQGDTTLSACVDEHGGVSNVQVVKSSGFPRLDQAAVDGLPGIRLEPARNADGLPVAYCDPPYTLTLAWQLS